MPNAIVSTGPWAKIERRLAKVMARRMVRLRNPKPMISFTFDDAPHTACTRGRRLLEQYKVRGTFYVCGGLTGQLEPERMHTLAELQALAAAGHELGCHGYEHIDYQSLNKDQMVSDTMRNAQFLSDLGVPTADLNFAYPFGCASPGVKRFVSRRYTSARGIGDGLNVGEVDLALLKATRLYEGRITDAEVTALIEDNVRQNGWLIFFTHGVQDKPDAYGCTPDMLEHALHISVQSGAEVLTVRDALQVALEHP
jgi:peptidoglycan/xylan/chitin deacetylase (PgdA/CDA1 family)